MGQLHQLIKRQGIEAARKEALDKLDRQCVDAAVAVMFDEQQRVGIMHAGFSMTALPHKDIRKPNGSAEAQGSSCLSRVGPTAICARLESHSVPSPE